MTAAGLHPADRREKGAAEAQRKTFSSEGRQMAAVTARCNFPEQSKCPPTALLLMDVLKLLRATVSPPKLLSAASLHYPAASGHRHFTSCQGVFRSRSGSDHGGHDLRTAGDRMEGCFCKNSKKTVLEPKDPPWSIRTRTAAGSGRNQIASV